MPPPTAQLVRYAAQAGMLVGGTNVAITNASITTSIVSLQGQITSANNAVSGLASSKQNVIIPGTTDQYWRGDETWQALNPAAVGLSNVTNAVFEPAISSGGTNQFWDGAKAFRVITTADISGLGTIATHASTDYEPAIGTSGTNTFWDGAKVFRGITVADVSGLGSVATMTAGVANGPLIADGGNKIPVANLPSSVVGDMQYQGTWNALANLPSLGNGTGTQGQFYKVAIAGSSTVNGINQWNIGDSIVYNGATWDKLDGIANEVVTVFGRYGTVIAQTGDYTYGQITGFASAAASYAPVQTVSGRSGNVMLTTTDIGGLGSSATNASSAYLPSFTSTVRSLIYATPYNGTGVTPSWRGMNQGDLPGVLDASVINNGVFDTAQIPNIFDQSLNIGDEPTFAGLTLTAGLTANDVTVTGTDLGIGVQVNEQDSTADVYTEIANTTLGPSIVVGVVGDPYGTGIGTESDQGLTGSFAGDGIIKAYGLGNQVGLCLGASDGGGPYSIRLGPDGTTQLNPIDPTTITAGTMGRLFAGNLGSLLYDTGTIVNTVLLSGQSIAVSKVTSTHIVGSTSAPTIAAGAGAGTSPTIVIAGTDLAGRITLTTGTLPTVSATVCTVTFHTAFSAAPYVILTLAGGGTGALGATAANVYVNETTTTFVVSVGTGGLTAATQYIWNYIVIG